MKLLSITSSAVDALVSSKQIYIEQMCETLIVWSQIVSHNRHNKVSECCWCVTYIVTDKFHRLQKLQSSVKHTKLDKNRKVNDEKIHIYTVCLPVHRKQQLKTFAVGKNKTEINHLLYYSLLKFHL